MNKEVASILRTRVEDDKAECRRDTSVVKYTSATRKAQSRFGEL